MIVDINIWGSNQPAYMWGYIVGYNGDTYDVRELITNNISFVGPEMVEKKPWFTAMLMGTWQSTVRSCGALFSGRCCLGDKEPGKACWNALKCSEMTIRFQGDYPTMDNLSLRTSSPGLLTNYRTSEMVLQVVPKGTVSWRSAHQPGCSSRLLCSR